MVNVSLQLWLATSVSAVLSNYKTQDFRDLFTQSDKYLLKKEPYVRGVCVRVRVHVYTAVKNCVPWRSLLTSVKAFLLMPVCSAEICSGSRSMDSLSLFQLHYILSWGIHADTDLFKSSLSLSFPICCRHSESARYQHPHTVPPSGRTGSLIDREEAWLPLSVNQITSARKRQWWISSEQSKWLQDNAHKLCIYVSVILLLVVVWMSLLQSWHVLSARTTSS